MQSHVQFIIHQTPHTLKSSRFDILYTPRSKYNMSSKYFFVNGIWPFFLNNSHFYKNRRLLIIRERSTVYSDTNFQSFYVSTSYKGNISEMLESIIENKIPFVHQFNCITTRTLYLLYNHGLLLFRNIWITWVNHYHFIFIFIKLSFYVTPNFF